MLFQSVALLALLGAAQAKPTARAPVTLEHDDVLVFRDGVPTVMKEWDYSIEEDKRELQRRRAGIQSEEAPAVARRAAAARSTKGRRCEESSEVQVLEETDFTNWDVTMSPVIANTGSSAAMVSVAQGYSVANSVSVSETVGATLESVLTVSMSIDVSETWTTTDTLTYNFNVPSGQYGVVVSNPYTHRVSGNVLSGCTDSPTSDSFYADSFTTQESNGLSWVSGPIHLCNSSSYPIPYCVGTGSHQ